MRVFFAINLPKNIKEKISLFVKSSKISGELVPKDNYHITLKFIGEAGDDEIKALINGAEKIKLKEFDCSIEKLGLFGNCKHPSIVFAALSKGLSELGKLSELIHKSSKNYEMSFDFQPHITLARNPEMLGIEKYDFCPENFRVKSFCLMKSLASGSNVKYKVVKSFELLK